MKFDFKMNTYWCLWPWNLGWISCFGEVCVHTITMEIGWISLVLQVPELLIRGALILVLNKKFPAGIFLLRNKIRTDLFEKGREERENWVKIHLFNTKSSNSTLNFLYDMGRMTKILGNLHPFGFFPWNITQDFGQKEVKNGVLKEFLRNFTNLHPNWTKTGQKEGSKMKP